MEQFYTFHLGGCAFLCLRDLDQPWYGTTLKRLR